MKCSFDICQRFKDLCWVQISSYIWKSFDSKWQNERDTQNYLLARILSSNNSHPLRHSLSQKTLWHELATKSEHTWTIWLSTFIPREYAFQKCKYPCVVKDMLKRVQSSPFHSIQTLKTTEILILGWKSELWCNSTVKYCWRNENFYDHGEVLPCTTKWVRLTRRILRDGNETPKCWFLMMILRHATNHWHILPRTKENKDGFRCNRIQLW